MTVRPPSTPLPPVLARMAAGLLIVGGGAVVAWRGVSVLPNPGLATIRTPLEFPLDGPNLGDLARQGSVRVEVDRVDITARALPLSSPELVQGEALHRARNAPGWTTGREGRSAAAELTLRVQDVDAGGVVVRGVAPLQHTATLNLTRAIPLTLSARTTSGDLTLNLAPLRLRALTLRSGSGEQAVSLPGRPGGPYSLVGGSGPVSVSAPTGASPEALRVNTLGGDQLLDLGRLTTAALGIGTTGGNVRVTLPLAFQRGTITTASGSVTATAPPGAHGNLDIRTQSGDITLRVPGSLRTRIRFTDRDTLTLPPGPAPTRPDLDVFVDTNSGTFTLQTPEGQPLSGTPSLSAPAPAAEPADSFSTPQGGSR